jgi:hypothetical protein
MADNISYAAWPLSAANQVGAVVNDLFLLLLPIRLFSAKDYRG